MIIGFAGRCAGIKQKDIYFNFNLWKNAQRKTYQIVGSCDSVFGRWPTDVAKLQMMKFVLPGDGIDDDQGFQINEYEILHREDYKKILKRGYMPWLFEHLSNIWNLHLRFPFCMPLIIPRLMAVNFRSANIAKFWNKRGIDVQFNYACYPPFDFLSLVRSLEPFFIDIMEIPKIIEKVCEKIIDDIIKFATIPLKFSKAGNKIFIAPMRSSASFISPQHFERFSLPYLKRMVEAFHKMGLISVLHLDGNWTPMLKYFKQFPATSCILEFDGQTDIFAAKAILGDILCIKGNVPAEMLAYASKEKVYEYCEKLNTEIGRSAGFILSSGCEVPENAKIENVKALIESIKL